MRKTILATAMLAAVSSAHADTDTREQFFKTYQMAVDNGIAAGASSAEKCDAVKCEHTMVYRDNKYWTTLHRFVYFSGNETETLCFMLHTDPNTSQCASSEGGLWRERFNGTKWVIVETFRTSWTDATS
jgi:hypothetical protein